MEHASHQEVGPSNLSRLALEAEVAMVHAVSILLNSFQCYSLVQINYSKCLQFDVPHCLHAIIAQVRTNFVQWQRFMDGDMDPETGSDWYTWHK